MQTEFDKSMYCKVVDDYDYFIKEIKINDEIIRKIFVVDIRTMSDERIENIFNNFNEFQRLILENDFFNPFKSIKNAPFTYSLNLNLIFLYDENRKYNINKYIINKHNILHNMNYAIKDFMTKSELQMLLNKEYLSEKINKEMLIELKNKVLKLRSFNYIHGNNGAGKTRLLNDISSSINVPIFSMNDISLNLEDYISDKDNIQNYMYQLARITQKEEYNDFQKYIYRLAQILQFSKEKNNVVLLDDLRWRSLSDRIRINIIETLFDYSCDNESVVITGCNQKDFIKRKIYKANIIDL